MITSVDYLEKGIILYGVVFIFILTTQFYIIFELARLRKLINKCKELNDEMFKKS